MMLLLFLTAFLFIALRAFQQLNVQHDRFMWVPPTTLLMALCEVVTITSIVKMGTLWSAIPLAAGGTLGCWFAMWFHRKMRERPAKKLHQEAVNAAAARMAQSIDAELLARHVHDTDAKMMGPLRVVPDMVPPEGERARITADGRHLIVIKGKYYEVHP